MSRIKVLVLMAVMVLSQLALCSEQAEAGPLLDWLRGCRNRCFSSTNAQTAGFAPNACGLQPGQCQTTCMKTCSRVVVNYVPCTAYRTSYKRIPVTQYKPVTKTDPCTGCTVTCMKPCTTYTYQSQRIPYTTYRPVYKTETYKVPVTTITNDCATGGCATGLCSTCPTPGMAPNAAGCATCNVPGQAIMSPGTTYTPLPSNSTPNGAVPTPADIPAADMSPTLNPQTQQRPLYERFQTQDSSQVGWPAPPAIQSNMTTDNKPAQIDVVATASPIRRAWSYNPIKLASYTSVVNSEVKAQAKTEPVQSELVQYQGAFTPARSTKQTERKTNTMWKSIDW